MLRPTCCNHCGTPLLPDGTCPEACGPVGPAVTAGVMAATIALGVVFFTVMVLAWEYGQTLMDALMEVLRGWWS